MKSMRRPLVRDELSETVPIASSLPRRVFKRLDDAAEFIGVTKAVLIRRAVCRYLQDMEERRFDRGTNPKGSHRPSHQGRSVLLFRREQPQGKANGGL
jgi:hypothetical protein